MRLARWPMPNGWPSSEFLIGVASIITAFFGGVVLVIREIRATHTAVNGRMSELLSAARQAALKEGELRGRDHSVSNAVDVQADRPSGAGVPQDSERR